LTGNLAEQSIPSKYEMEKTLVFGKITTGIGGEKERTLLKRDGNKQKREISSAKAEVVWLERKKRVPQRGQFT